MRAHKYNPPVEPRLIGADGFAMLMLSTTLMVLSCGATLLLSLGYVVWFACRTRFDAPASRRILVLGMRRLDPKGKPGRDYQQRLTRAAALWTRNRATEIVILGGRAATDLPSEAAAGAVFLRACGVATEAIRLVDRSRHTLENLILYRAPFNAEPEPAVLVTSRFHLAHSSLLASGLSIAPVACAAEQARVPLCRHVPLMLFEAVLIHWYITGRSFARFTDNRRLAARIS